MKKVQKIVILVLCVALGLFAFAACGPKESGDKVTVTFYDATGTNKPAEMKVLKTQKVTKGETVASYVPTKDGGYDFVNWFATPSKSHVFDFTTKIDKDTSIYGGFSKFVADTRDYYIIGTGTSKVLLDGWNVANSDASWDAVKANHKFTKSSATDKNEYTMTLDLMENDQFVLMTNRQYYAKRGYGYLDSLKLEDGTEVFSGQGSVYDDSSKGSNIKVEKSGNYTLTLTTHPDDDYYNTEGNGYTEENKEIYNLNPYDKISWVRNGDPLEVISTTTAFYIKGAKITDWKSMYNDATLMTKNDDEHTMSIYLRENEEFMFVSRVTDIATGNVSDGATFIKSNLLDAEGQKLIDGYTENGGNMKAKASGTYTFVYNEKTNKLVVTFDASKTPERFEYYLNGNVLDKDYNGCIEDATELKFTQDANDSFVYTFKNAALKVGDEFRILSYPENTDKIDWNFKTQYHFAYLHPSSKGANFGTKTDTDTNIMVKVAGTYDIVFDSYSKIIKITPSAAA